jgi:hypothetical protein
MQYVLAAIMGLVEGLTEFIPVSSTGHLILADHFLGFQQSVGEDVAKTFEVVVQFAAILAVVAAYPGRFARLCDFRSREGFAGIRGLTLLAVTSGRFGSSRSSVFRAAGMSTTSIGSAGARRWPWGFGSAWLFGRACRDRRRRFSVA